MTCRAVSIYYDTLTRGRVYDLIEQDAERRQVRIRGDNGRHRWFPLSCFGIGEIELPILKSFEICDDLSDVDEGYVDVVITLSTGERRLCFFATPTTLSNCGDALEGTNVRYHCGPNLIVATSLSEEIIGQILDEMNSQDKLLSNTVSLEAD